METQKQYLERLYSDTPTEDLLDLYERGTLTELATGILVAELGQRNVPIAPLPEQVEETSASNVEERRFLYRLTLFSAGVVGVNIVWVVLFQPWLSGALPYALLVGIPTILLMKANFSQKKRRRYKEGTTALMLAAGLESINEVEEALTNDPTSVNAQDKEGCSALHFATQREATAIVERLLSAGIDRNLRTVNGQTAADIARRQKWSEGVVLLEGKAENKGNSLA